MMRRTLALDGAHPLLLNGADDYWLIETGSVDVFAVPLVDGVEAGGREHLGRLAAGQSLLGLGPASATAATGLLAVGLPGAQLIGDERGLAAALESPQEAGLAAEAIVAWLLMLGGALYRPAPRAAIVVGAGGMLEVEAGAELSGGNGVVWLSTSGIDAAPAGLIRMPGAQSLSSNPPFPLTPASWASVKTRGRLHCRSTFDLAMLGPASLLMAGLASFHAFFLDELRERRLAFEAAQPERLLRRKRADRLQFAAGLKGMVDALASEPDGSALPVDSGDALLDACQLVLQASGFRGTLQHVGRVDEARDLRCRVEQLAGSARAIPREVALTGAEWWRKDQGALLAFDRDDGRPLALLPRRGRGYRVIDPLDSTESVLDDAGAASLAPQAFMFLRRFPDRKITFAMLLRFGLAGSWRDISWLLMTGAAGGLLGLMLPYVTGVLIDSVLPAAQTKGLRQLVLLLLGAAIGISAFELTRAIAMLRIDGRIDMAVEAAMIDRLLHLPTAFFRDFAAGDLAQRVASISTILQFLSNATHAVLLGWVFSLFSFAYLFAVSWQLALLAGGLVALALCVTLGLNVWRLNLERRVFKVQGEIASRVLQILNGIAKLRTDGAERRVFALWSKDYARQKRLNFASRRISNLLTVFNAGYAVLISMLVYAAIAYFLPKFSAGSFITFNAAFSQFFISTIAMTSALTSALIVIPMVERVLPVLQTLPESGAAQETPGELSGAIEISHVTFRYQTDGPAILRDLSIRIEPGEFIAFVGPSGSGKSTVFRLLLGFERAETGAIYYDGRNLAGLDAGAVRRQLGVVLQNGKLMPGDIFTNIVGAAPLTLDDAWEAARMAGFEADIKAMPMGMHTIISEGSATISGGQKQRLMVARAIVKRPRILLFDEATSALDNQTQAIVARSIERLNATRIVIAHRLSTVMKADRIFLIEDGQVSESGNFSELMELNGRFAALAQRQLA
jgi:NHLM bacteriocin system ABC transporter ATP-binding protein